jgi:hypothetical protein
MDPGLERPEQLVSRFPLPHGFTAKSRYNVGPEKRLWKVCLKSHSSHLEEVDYIALLYFGIVSAVALGYCFDELFQLNGTMNHTVQLLLAR